MVYILNLETATKNCSVSLTKNGETILVKEVSDQGYSHAEKLHVFIDEILSETVVSMQDLSAIAVSQGPGSYTGLRIGISAAKGLCYSLGIPLIAVDTLESLARQVQQKDGLIVPMIDARRMEVYSAIFDHDYNKLRAVAAEIITNESYADYKGTVYFIGDCQEKCSEVLKNENFKFLNNVVFPSANEMGVLSYSKFLNKEFVDVAYFEPFYLKDFLLTTSKK
jgi:tRNA threonylcarbamoyladenosine biosynthesis protein TsaB